MNCSEKTTPRYQIGNIILENPIIKTSNWNGVVIYEINGKQHSFGINTVSKSANSDGLMQADRHIAFKVNSYVLHETDNSYAYDCYIGILSDGKATKGKETIILNKFTSAVFGNEHATFYSHSSKLYKKLDEIPTVDDYEKIAQTLLKLDYKSYAKDDYLKIAKSTKGQSRKKNALLEANSVTTASLSNTMPNKAMEMIQKQMDDLISQNEAWKKQDDENKSQSSDGQWIKKMIEQNTNQINFLQKLLQELCPTNTSE